MMMSVVAFHSAAMPSVSDAAKTAAGPQVRRLPVRGVLKPYAAPSVSKTPEHEFWFNYAEDPYTGELPVGRYKDMSSRRAAIDRYHAAEAELAAVPARTPRLVLAVERVRHFAIDAAPDAIRAEEEAVSSVALLDAVAPYAARVLDLLHERFSKNSFHEAQAAQIAYVYVKLEVDRCRAVLGTAVFMEDMVVSALAQTDDLIQRTEARLERLAVLARPQHNVRTILRMRADAFFWEEEDEADFVEKALTRIPDALTQRYLIRRVSSGGGVGLDATASSLSALREVAAVLTLLLP